MTLSTPPISAPVRLEPPLVSDDTISESSGGEGGGDSPETVGCEGGGGSPETVGGEGGGGSPETVGCEGGGDSPETASSGVAPSRKAGRV